MKRPERILVVDDENLIRWAAVKDLENRGFQADEAETVSLAIEALSAASYDLVLLDHLLPDGTGIDVLREIHHRMPHVGTIMITAVNQADVAVQAMKLGAFDYITKPFDFDALSHLIERCLVVTRLKRRFAGFEEEESSPHSFCGIIGNSPACHRVFEDTRRFAHSSVETVLITGESGTGKELVARALHSLSDRKDKPFVAVNCAAIPTSLMESQLFGHEKGAFTDARARTKGVFEQAEGGVLLLDEIGELAEPLQAVLLRMIDQKAFRRIGGTEDIQANVRILASTNQNLQQRMHEGIFRSDLFFRLNVLPIHIPPLRERGDDVILLAEHFLHQCNVRLGKTLLGLADETRKQFLRYDWPGNVRELKNVILRGAVSETQEYLSPQYFEFEHLPHMEHAQFPNPDMERDSGHNLSTAIGELEKTAIQKALLEAGYNQSKAARLLGISRDTLRYRMKKYGFSQSED
jgi:two-component system, NtrC family, response regulator AtoC